MIKKMSDDRGFNDLERTIDKLKTKIENLKQDNLTLTKEIDRLSECNHNLETMLRK